MSLRPSLFGFELPRFRALFGSCDADAAERACAELSRRVRDAARLAEAQEIARRAVMTGVPFVGLDEEKSPHVEAAIALAKTDQTLDEMRSDSWNVEPIRDLATLFPELPRGSFNAFVEGRPVFGKQIASGWSYYGFLSTSELETLLTDLAPIRNQLRAAPSSAALAADARVRLLADLKHATEGVTDDETLKAYLARLLAEGIALGDRALHDSRVRCGEEAGLANSRCRQAARRLLRASPRRRVERESQARSGFRRGARGLALTHLFVASRPVLLRLMTPVDR